MIQQIEDIISKISLEDRFEDDAVIINTYIKQLKQRIAELEHEGQLQWDTHQMCQSINLNKIRELESPNYFPEPKTCEGCKYYEAEDLYMGYCMEISTDVNNKWGCLSYEPKEQI